MTSLGLNIISYYEAQTAAHLGLENAKSRQCMKDSAKTPYHFSFPRIHWVDRSTHWNIGSTHLTQTGSSLRNPGSLNREQEKKAQEAQERKYAIAGIVISLVSAFSFGYFYSRAKGYFQNLEHSASDLTKIDEIVYHSETNLRDSLKHLVGRCHQIHQDQYSEAKNDALSALILLTGGCGLFVGGMGSVPLLRTVSSVVCFLGAVGFCLNKGVHWDDADRHFQIRQTLLSLDPKTGKNEFMKVRDEVEAYHRTHDPSAPLLSSDLFNSSELNQEFSRGCRPFWAEVVGG